MANKYQLTTADDGDNKSEDYDFTSYVATTHYPPYPGPQDEEQRLLGQAHQTLRRLYAEGVPFFTKAAIQDIVDQIDYGTSIVSVPGLDGSKLDLPIRTGEIYPVDTERDSIYVMQKTVENIVAFGCGTLQCKPATESTAQYALVLMLRDLLARRPQLQQLDAVEASPGGSHSRTMTEVSCFAQDPIHTDVDKQILLEHGITVVDDPRGFLKVDDASIVVSLSSDIPVQEIIADIARPDARMGQSACTAQRGI
ncbi:hypothetical protein N0V82_001611 [Gnomoniopsis sp. IMI 355080]|nr:hypothetical protein N0V82_001611 [Gnomoniopsis sp. IMI 355080]